MTNEFDDEGMLEQFADLVADGASMELATTKLRSWKAPADRVGGVLAEFDRRRLGIRALNAPAVLAGGSASSAWYLGPRPNDVRWPKLAARLATRVDDSAVKAIDAASTKIVSFLNPPGEAKFSTRGLVLGNVQSGKTTNFMAVIAKAADRGYRLVIVLSGTTDSLRNQTQERIDGVLVSEDRGWAKLTSSAEDFSQHPETAAGVLGRRGRCTVIVIKKQADRLRNLRDWLAGAGAVVAAGIPVLMIDDEADDSSIDVGQDGERSMINGLIRQILDRPRAAYLAYTATPFANILIDPRDPDGLYPRDFIVDLPTSPDYFGAERIFGRSENEPDDSEIDGLDVVREVLPEEASAITSHGQAGEVSIGALRQATRWYLLATSARRVRWDGQDHSTMLVHTSMLADDHRAVAGTVRGIVSAIRRGVEARDEQELGALRELYELETSAIAAADFGHEKVPFEAVLARLEVELMAVDIIIDDYLSDERLVYRDDRPSTVIVIGGNTLSRGLTLEGLCSSYFVRSSPSYDTLLQMGRWFGYRLGYEDLFRIWTTATLAEWFRDLALVEAEIRREIRRYEVEGLEPAAVAVRIRTHPAMAITSAVKARHAVKATVSFSGARPQTTLFHHRDRRWLRGNIQAVSELVGRLSNDGFSEVSFGRSRPGFRDVPVKEVIRFLRSYQAHERSQNMRLDVLEAYVDREVSAGSLRLWNIVVSGRQADATNLRATIDLGFREPVGLANRSAIHTGDRYTTNLKSIINTEDRLADLEIQPADVAALIGEGEADDLRFMAAREALGAENGLMVIYPIDKDSAPDAARVSVGGLNERVPLSAVDHIVGLALFFPKAQGSHSDVEYMVAPLEPVAASSVLPQGED